MGFFKDADEVYRIIGGMMMETRSHDQMGPKIKASGLIIQFKYSDPESQITIDAKTPEEGYFFNVLFGPNDLEPKVMMTMSADIAHKFWLGKVNLTAALTRGQMKAKGPIQDILKLLPAIKPAYTLYPEFLKQQGLDGLII
ncbi:MAG: SCP2 sterol-binding domain-containing protein [Desulfocucumaceae bacterium]